MHHGGQKKNNSCYKGNKVRMILNLETKKNLRIKTETKKPDSSTLNSEHLKNLNRFLLNPETSFKYFKTKNVQKAK